MDIEIKQFNIRVYGLCLNAKEEVLVTDEFRLGMYMTKFPGGGLHFGEGTIDCLRREFMEELGRELDNIRHFYTTDYFQPTRLLGNPQQLISIYYRLDIRHADTIPVVKTRFDFDKIDGAQTFRWLALQEACMDEITFPIDKKVFEMLIPGWGNR
jgi:8-oxo-dGTP pyrophosphatase MutT (NUDIX family)